MRQFNLENYVLVALIALTALAGSIALVISLFQFRKEELLDKRSDVNHPPSTSRRAHRLQAKSTFRDALLSPSSTPPRRAEEPETYHEPAEGSHYEASAPEPVLRSARQRRDTATEIRESGPCDPGGSDRLPAQ